MKLNTFYMSASLLAMCGADAMAQQRPNIVFILADDMGYGDLTCYNADSKINTPNMDRLAADGQLYMDAHSSSSVSTPSRYSIITGRYSWRSSLKKGVLGGYSPALIEKDRPTVASMLKANGYTTACIGKWHLGMGWGTTDGQQPAADGKNVDFKAPLKDSPVTRGFDYYFGTSASLDMPPYLLLENDKVLEQPDIFLDGRGTVHPYQTGRAGHGIEGRGPEYFLPALTDKTVEKIGEYSKQKNPFFIYFALTAPHNPEAPNKEFVGRSKAGRYGDFVLEVDHVVSRVVKALKENGLYENTLIVVTSDNGPETSAYKRALQYEHYSTAHLKGVKRDLWEGGHRVPFIVSWPKGVKKMGKVKTTVCLADFYATAADIVNYKPEAKEAEDSYSFLPLMQGKVKTDRICTIHHSGKGRFAIRKGDWVLIETRTGDDNRGKGKAYYEKRGYELEQNDGELFNLAADPREFKNEYADRPEVVKELRALLDETRK